MKLDAMVGPVSLQGASTHSHGGLSASAPGPLAPLLPQRVTEVPRDVLRAFPHTKRVGNYLLGKTLGEGSFAKV